MLGYVLFVLAILIALVVISAPSLRTRRIMTYLAGFLALQYLVTVHFTWEFTQELAWVMKISFFLIVNAILAQLMKPFVKKA